MFPSRFKSVCLKFQSYLELPIKLCLKAFVYILEDPPLLKPVNATIKPEKPASSVSYVGSNAIDGDPSTFSAADYRSPDKKGFWFDIDFGRNYLFVYFKCLLLTNQGFELTIATTESRVGEKYLGYFVTAKCKNQPQTFRSSYKVIKGRYVQLKPRSTGAFTTLKLAEIEFYGI